MFEKNVNPSQAMNLFGSLMASTLIESPMGKSYLRVENAVEHTRTYYAVEVGRNEEGKTSILLPIANDDKLPICYVTQRHIMNGGMEASIVVSDDAERNTVLVGIVNILRRANIYSGINDKYLKFHLPDTDRLRITIRTVSISADEMLELLDKVGMSPAEQVELDKRTVVNEVDTFLRKLSK